MNQLVLGHIALPTGGQMQLQQVEFGKGSPLLSIVSGLHGDEYNGLGTCIRLVQFLTKVEQHRTPYQLQGRIRIMPTANPLGLMAGERLWPFDHSDLNRLFPGYVAGEVVQRLAHLIYEGVRSSTLCVDIHSGGDLAEWPQVRSFRDQFRILQSCQALGLPLAWVRSSAQLTKAKDLEVVSVRQGTLSATLQQAGVDSLVIAAGHSHHLDPLLAQQLCESLIRLGLHLGVLRGPALPAPPGHQAQRVRTVFSQRAGVWLGRAMLGRGVQREDPLGEVVDPLSGEVLELVTAPAAGLVMSLRHQPLVQAGAMVARVALPAGV